MNVVLSIVALRSKKSGFLWKAKVDRTDVRNGVQIRKGKTGRVLFWFSVQAQQQSCDKDEMMWADEWRVIRFQNKNHSSKHLRFDRLFCESKKKQMKSIRMASVGKLSDQQNEKVQMKSADNQNLQKQINWISCKFNPSNSSRLSLPYILFRQEGITSNYTGQSVVGSLVGPSCLWRHSRIRMCEKGPQGLMVFLHIRNSRAFYDSYCYIDV